MNRRCVRQSLLEVAVGPFAMGDGAQAERGRRRGGLEAHGEGGLTLRLGELLGPEPRPRGWQSIKDVSIQGR
jgi:hypothetical protein